MAPQKGTINTAVNFTKRSLLAIEPQNERIRYRDVGGAASVRGLGLEVLPNGKKTFRFEQKVNQRNIKVTLGTFPELTVEQAREMAKNTAHEIAQGINPNAIKKQQKNAQDFDDLFAFYIVSLELDVKAGTRRENAIQKAETLYRLHLKPRIGKSKIDGFLRANAKTVLNKILADKGYSLHNHSLTLLKSMFNRAEYDYNPFSECKKIDEALHRRERILSPEELQRLFQAIDIEEPIYRDCVLMLLLTGQRKACVFSMQWSEINTTNQTWIIPTSKIKSKKPHVVPLSIAAMKVLNERKTQRSDSDFVFASSNSQSGHIADKSSAGGFWRRIVKRAELYNEGTPETNIRIHDLRRTLASYQVQSGGSIQTTSKLLGHSSINITSSTYAHLSVDNVREDLERTTAAIFQIGTGEVNKLSGIKSQILQLSNDEKRELIDFLNGCTSDE
jgi:integrase